MHSRLALSNQDVGKLGIVLHSRRPCNSKLQIEISDPLSQCKSPSVLSSDFFNLLCLVSHFILAAKELCQLGHLSWFQFCRLESPVLHMDTPKSYRGSRCGIMETVGAVVTAVSPRALIVVFAVASGNYLAARDPYLQTNRVP